MEFVLRDVRAAFPRVSSKMERDGTPNPAARIHPASHQIVKVVPMVMRVP
jgi:ATP-dependent helicase YprA (DUF1998 family)